MRDVFARKQEHHASPTVPAAPSASDPHLADTAPERHARVGSLGNDADDPRSLGIGQDSLCRRQIRRRLDDGVQALSRQ